EASIRRQAAWIRLSTGDWTLPYVHCVLERRLQSRRGLGAHSSYRRIWLRSHPGHGTHSWETLRLRPGSSGHPQHRRTPALRGCLRCRLPGSFFEVPPVAPVALKEFFGFLRTPGSSGIVWKISRRKRLPHIEDRTDNAPSSLDHVSALEQRLVA